MCRGEKTATAPGKLPRNKGREQGERNFMGWGKGKVRKWNLPKEEVTKIPKGGGGGKRKKN